MSLLKRSSSAKFERTKVLVTTITARTLRHEIVTSRPRLLHREVVSLAPRYSARARDGR